MGEPFVMHINMGAKCPECGKGGATQSGICLHCMTSAISNKPMRSRQGQAYQKYVLTQLQALRPSKP